MLPTNTARYWRGNKQARHTQIFAINIGDRGNARHITARAKQITKCSVCSLDYQCYIHLLFDILTTACLYVQVKIQEIIRYYHIQL